MLIVMSRESSAEPELDPPWTAYPWIFTSNKHPDDWGAVLHDDDLAAAIVDRVLERGRLLHLDGPSMRTKHLGPDAPALDERQPSAASPALHPQRGQSQGREAPRRNDEGSLDAQA